MIELKRKNKNRGYMQLDVWQKAIDLFRCVWKTVYVDYQIDFKLRAQAADAAQSVSANIAEGYGRRSINEYIQFLYIASGSLAETLTRLIGLKETDQISPHCSEEIETFHYEVENKLLRLIESLENKRKNQTWVDHLAEDTVPYNTEQSEYSKTPTLQHSNTP